MFFERGLRSDNIRLMMLKIMALTFIATICSVSVLFYFQARSYAIREAEKKIKNLLLEHQALHTYIAKHQKPAIIKLKEQGKLDKDYFSPEILSSSYITKYMHQYYNELRKKNDLSEFYYKMAANNPRNPQNKSDEFERDLIKQFNAGGIKEFKKEVSIDGSKFLYYALPFVPNTQDCMACHSSPDIAPRELIERYGDKNGFGEKVGDIRAIISIRAPLGPEIQQANRTFLKTGGMILGVFLMLFSVGGWVLMRSVTRPIKQAVNGLCVASEQVAAASEQISSSGQQLAEGASRQASAIEETSACLEEMAVMTKRNSRNASEANRLVTDSKAIVEQANHSMADLTTSMKEISKAGEETQKIVKTIDEIAFQTNLLALNAAVEAARAGEAGAGFAVVADEVRGLALRAAEAAKNTAGLIAGTVKKVKEGSSIVEKTNDAFRMVTETVTKSGELIGEIAAASQEQAQGIDQVNRAVTEMDKVTQQNSANAEQTAASAEAMSEQAEQMTGFVGNLSSLVGGKENMSGRQSTVPRKRQLPSTVNEAFKKSAAGAGAHKNGNGYRKKDGQPAGGIAAKIEFTPFSGDKMDSF